MDRDIKLGLIVALLTLIVFLLMLLSYYYGMNTAVRLQKAFEETCNTSVKFSFPYIYVSYPMVPDFDVSNVTTKTFK